MDTYLHLLVKTKDKQKAVRPGGKPQPFATQPLTRDAAVQEGRSDITVFIPCRSVGLIHCKEEQARCPGNTERTGWTWRTEQVVLALVLDGQGKGLR